MAACLRARTQVLLHHSWTSARTRCFCKLSQKVHPRVHCGRVLNQPKHLRLKRQWCWARAGQIPQAVKPLFHWNVHGTWTTHRRCVCLHRHHLTSRHVQRRIGRREERDARRDEIKANKCARTRKQAWRRACDEVLEAEAESSGTFAVETRRQACLPRYTSQSTAKEVWCRRGTFQLVT